MPGPSRSLPKRPRSTPRTVSLVVGCATGYSAAVLARLAGEVIALDSSEALLDVAGKALGGLPRVRTVRADLRRGAPEFGPYDVIFVDGGVEDVPLALTAQLKDGGRLLTVVMKGPSGRGRIIVRVGETLSGRNLFDASVPVLPGFVHAPTFVF